MGVLLGLLMIGLVCLVISALVDYWAASLRDRD